MKEKIKVLRIIHLAICGGAILFYILSGAMINMEFPSLDSPSLPYLIIPFAALALSTILFKSQLKQANKSLNLEENMGVYQTASIIRYAILEGAAILILILAPDLLIFGILIILYLAILRPSEERIKRDLKYLD